MKMIGKTARLCDSRYCTCNSARRGKAPKRMMKRRERQAFRKFLSTI